MSTAAEWVSLDELFGVCGVCVWCGVCLLREKESVRGKHPKAKSGVDPNLDNLCWAPFSYNCECVYTGAQKKHKKFAPL